MLYCLFSCSPDTENQIITDDENNSTAKEIYFMWTEDLNCDPKNQSPPKLCITSMANYITYTHLDLPEKPIKNTKYKVRPGKFTIFVKQIESNGGSMLSQELKFTEPENGYRRFYTHTIKEHSFSTNRCGYKFQIMPYIDEPIN